MKICTQKNFSYSVLSNFKKLNKFFFQYQFFNFLNLNLCIVIAKKCTLKKNIKKSIYFNCLVQCNWNFCVYKIFLVAPCVYVTVTEGIVVSPMHPYAPSTTIVSLHSWNRMVLPRQRYLSPYWRDWRTVLMVAMWWSLGSHPPPWGRVKAPPPLVWCRLWEHTSRWTALPVCGSHRRAPPLGSRVWKCVCVCVCAYLCMW